MTETQTREMLGTERLVRLERMMTDAYDAALGRIQQARIKEALVPFREHHQQNAQALLEIAGREEGTAPQLEPQFARYVEEVLETIEESVRRDEAVGELRIAEAALNMVYGQVLSETTDEDVRRAIKECMRSEAEHLGVLAIVHEVAKT